MVDITCKFCKRWLGETDETLIATIKCSNSKCKQNNNIKIVTTQSTVDQINYVFKKQTPKQK